MTIPKSNAVAATAAAKPQTVAAGQTPKRYNPLLDLLDEAGVESRPTGPCCDNCGAQMSPTAIICIECGFNMATRQKLETAVLIEDEDRVETDKMTDGEKLLARAEKAIDDSPVTSEGQDFGDDAGDSTMVMFIAAGGALMLIAVGLFCMLAMEKILDMTGLSSPQISVIISIFMWLACGTWISILAFSASPAHGLGCVLSLGLYCPIFGFMQGKGLFVPSIVMIMAVAIGLLSYAVWSFTSGEIEDARALIEHGNFLASAMAIRFFG
ncbi:MAG: hypothetical protein ABL888_05495 [Pirellulaceae bacterium]